MPGAIRLQLLHGDQGPKLCWPTFSGSSAGSISLADSICEKLLRNKTMMYLMPSLHPSHRPPGLKASDFGTA